MVVSKLDLARPILPQVQEVVRAGRFIDWDTYEIFEPECFTGICDTFQSVSAAITKDSRLWIGPTPKLGETPDSRYRLVKGRDRSRELHRMWEETIRTLKQIEGMTV